MLEAELARSLRAKEPMVWWRKIVNVRWKAPPFDYVAITGWKAYGIECKMIRHKYFPFPNLKVHQEASLNYFDRLGKDREAYVMINYRNWKKRRNECFAIRWPVYAAMKKECIELKGRQSLPIKMCKDGREGVYPLKRVKVDNNYGWELDFIPELY